MARAYATLRERRLPRSTARSSATTPRAVECVAQAGQGMQGQRARPDAGAEPERDPEPAARRDHRLAAPGRRAVRDGHRGCDPRPPGRRQDRHDRELRRRVVRRLHAADRHGRLGRVPEQARADAARVPRARGRGRHLSGADLEGVHDSGARLPQPPAGGVPAGVVALRRTAPSDVPQQPDRAGQRQLQERRDRRLLLRRRADDGRELQAQRGRRA